MGEVPEDYPTVPCRSVRCGKPVWWTYSERGNRLPVNPTPAADGNLTLTLVDGEIRSAHVTADTPTQDTLDGAAPPRRYRPHWADCPDADMFRTRGRP